MLIDVHVGGPGHTNFASFSAAMIVVGGSGITFGLSVIKDLVDKDLKGKSRVKVIEFIWTVPDACKSCLSIALWLIPNKYLCLASVVPFIPTFASLINQSVFTPLRITVHYTRASHTVPSVPTIPGLAFSPGRPRIGKVIDYVVSKALSLGTRFDVSDINMTYTFNENSIKGSTGQPHYACRGYDGVFYEKKAMRKLHVDVDAASESREKEDIQVITGVVVGVCGPVELARDVIDAVGGVDGDRRSRVGGIEVHEEYVIFLVISSNS